ncbi:MAG: sulfite reductase subunit C [Nitrospirota bacterium]
MYNTKKIIKNAFRISKVRGESAIRLRIPGGNLNAGYLDTIKKLAQNFGDGSVHLSIRQGFEIPGVKLSQLLEIKQFMAGMVYDIEAESGIILEKPEEGYPSAGTRNVSACIGDRVCCFSNCDTTALARKIEQAIYPNDYHLKIAVCGCPNDCIKAHVQDIGIIAGVIPKYDSSRCIGCKACIDNCRLRVTNALSMKNYKIIRDENYCLNCGECILKCPAGAFSRGRRIYRIVIGGRTGKSNPRLANTFMECAEEDVVLGICKNVYLFIHRYIDHDLPKEHLGYIIDRIGLKDFTREVTEGVNLNSEIKIAKDLYNPGYFYPVKTAC